MTNSRDFPLLSVIIPTYNYGSFISKSIKSVLQQSYPNVEIIVVDDGSSDDTKRVVAGYPSVRYFYQTNKGLPASRNVGIEKARGSFLVFLDADDWLEADALQNNYAILHNKPDVAFVSGNYYLLCKEQNLAEPVVTVIETDHYIHLLKSNYIGMHAAVMFQRWVFDEFRYDETLRSCEDYDLYLRIARKYRVLHHPAFVATYNFHPSGLSHNYKTMMETVTAVIKKQLPCIKTVEEFAAYEEGLQQWKEYDSLMKDKTTNA